MMAHQGTLILIVGLTALIVTNIIMEEVFMSAQTVREKRLLMLVRKKSGIMRVSMEIQRRDTECQKILKQHRSNPVVNLPEEKINEH